MRHTRRIGCPQNVDRIGAVPGRTPLAMCQMRRLVSQFIAGSDAVCRGPGLRDNGGCAFRRVPGVTVLCHFDRRTPCVSFQISKEDSVYFR